MLPSKRFWIQSFFAGLLALTATAQNAPADRDPTRPLTVPAVDPQAYVIRANDILVITVRPHRPSIPKLIKRRSPSDMTVLLSDMTVRVRVDGTIVLPTIRPVKAEGLTLAQLRTQLAKELSIEETDIVLDRQTITPAPVERR
jgi:protein involved in polysaccharide export with SLBB domain